MTRRIELNILFSVTFKWVPLWVRHDGQDTMEPASRKEEERRQVTRIPVRDEAKRGERGRYGDFPLRKAACTVRRSAGSRPNALSLLSEPLRPFATSARPPAPNRLDNLCIYYRGDTTSISVDILAASRPAFPRAFPSFRAQKQENFRKSFRDRRLSSKRLALRCLSARVPFPVFFRRQKIRTNTRDAHWIVNGTTIKAPFKKKNGKRILNIFPALSSK